MWLWLVLSCLFILCMYVLARRHRRPVCGIGTGGGFDTNIALWLYGWRNLFLSVESGVSCDGTGDVVDDYLLYLFTVAGRGL